jgi:hypothetical protein
MRRFDRGPVFLGAVFVAVIAVCELVGTYDRPIAVVEYSGNAAFGLFLLTAVLLERQGAARSGTTLDLRWLGAAVGSLALAFAVWNTAKAGSPLCWPHSVYQGHGVWHLLCALSAWCLFRLYVSEEPVSSPSVPDPPNTASAARA